MILASRIPDLTDQMLAATLRAAADPSHGTDRWLLLAEVERLERRLLVCLDRLGYPDMATRRAA
jgi:hypothetical protein